MKPKIIAGIPCYKSENIIKDLVYEIKSGEKGRDTWILTYIDGRTDNTLDILMGLQKSDGLPEVILFCEENKGLGAGFKNSFTYLRGEKPEDVEVIEVKNRSLRGYGPEAGLIGGIASDGQQRFWEIFDSVGLPVLEGECEYGFIERENSRGDSIIKMPKKRIEKEIIINKCAVEALWSTGYDVRQLISDMENTGPGGGVRDLQTNRWFSGKVMEGIHDRLIGNRYSTELEISMFAVMDGKGIAWGIRKDYGHSAELPENWEEVWGSHAKEKLGAVKKHTLIGDEEFGSIIKSVVGRTVYQGLASSEVGDLVLRYSPVEI